MGDKENAGKRSIGFLAVGPDHLVTPVLGRLRRVLAERLLTFDPAELRFLWVQDFPLFLPTEEDSPSQSAIEPAHHPFTQPHADDLALLDSDPLAVRSLHYDLVLNGQEVGGGSVRVHDPALQEKILREVMGVDPAELGHLLEALGMGCPPHGGLALGLDRLVAILCGDRAASIRDVIAFPKSADGKDLMADAPAEISKEEKEFYGISIVPKEETK